MLSAQARKPLLGCQRNEITEHHIYRRLALLQRSEENRRVLERIAADEKRHYEQWKSYTGVAYVLTVVLLILPCLVVPNVYAALACTLAIAVLIIAFFNYYLSVAGTSRSEKRFIEMAGLSLSRAQLHCGIRVASVAGRGGVMVGEK